MSGFSITETDIWSRVVAAIRAEQDRRMAGLLRIATLEDMRREQGFLDGLQFVLDEARSRPQHRQYAQNAQAPINATGWAMNAAPKDYAVIWDEATVRSQREGNE